MKVITIVLGFITIVRTVYSQDTVYNAITQKLFIIEELDQRYRKQFDEVISKYGNSSEEIHVLSKKMNQADSINLIQVKSIIDKYGWLGVDDIGVQCSTTLFLVIQHSDLKTQEHYLPIMREAVKNKKASPNRLALLEDRVAIRQGKKQIYGSQIRQDEKTLKYYVLPLTDPDNVDKRRAEVGLEPIAEYVSHWDIKWDVEQYKKDLPAIEAESKDAPK